MLLVSFYAPYGKETIDMKVVKVQAWPPWKMLLMELTFKARIFSWTK